MRLHHMLIAVTFAGFLIGHSAGTRMKRLGRSIRGQHPVGSGKALSIAIFETIRAANDSGIRQFTRAKFSRKTRTVSWQGLTRCGLQ
jgi:hypothetical protein